MSLSIGIVGLPNVGKSTLFNALLKRQVALAANYPFATIEPNVGMVDVPDTRLRRLAEIVRVDHGLRMGNREIPEKIIPAVVKFHDIAGLVKGASTGEGLGNEFLSHIRDVDVILQVVRDFDGEDVVRAGSVSPETDIEVINTELILADIQVLDKKIDKLSKEVKSDKVSDDYRKLTVIKSVREALGNGSMASSLGLSEKEQEYVKELNLLTLKPMIYVLNVSEGKQAQNPKVVNANNAEIVTISAKIESEIASIESDTEKIEFMEALGLEISGLDKVIEKCFKLLKLEVFLTMGPKEVRAWTIKKGTKAPQAAGVIHTDFERGFISAEIVSYYDLDRVGSLKNAKEKGMIRLEGKDYVMADGDVTEFHFSV